MKSLQIGGCKGSVLTRHSEGKNPVQQYCSVTGRANPDAPVTFHAAACLRYNFIERPARKNDSEHHFIGALDAEAGLCCSKLLCFGCLCSLFEDTSQWQRQARDLDRQVAQCGRREEDPHLDRGAPHEVCTMGHCKANSVQHCRQLQLAPPALLDSRRWQVPDQSSWRR